MLSESVAKALELTGGEEVTETVKFIKMMDHFFDCLNVNNFHTGKQKRKQLQDPYRSGDDFRLKVIFIFVCPTSIMLHAVTTFATNPMQWLEDEFLGYLQNWEGLVMAQSGLSMKEKNSMLLSPKTRFGIEVTGKYIQFCLYIVHYFIVLLFSFSVRSFIEITKLVFKIPGVKVFLSERLSQDPLEVFWMPAPKRWN